MATAPHQPSVGPEREAREAGGGGQTSLREGWEPPRGAGGGEGGDFTGGKFRNCGRGISTGREELTQPGGAEAVIRAGSRGPAPLEPGTEGLDASRLNPRQPRPQATGRRRQAPPRAGGWSSPSGSGQRACPWPRKSEKKPAQPTAPPPSLRPLESVNKHQKNCTIQGSSRQ